MELPILTTGPTQAETQEPAAPAKTEEAPRGLFGGGFLLPMIVIVGIFYFVLILPEKKKQKQREAMLSAVKKGDRVMTTSGMYGDVVQTHEDVITLQIADGVRVRFNRAAIQSVVEDSEDS